MAERVYIVQHIEWEYSDEWYYPVDDTPVKAFLSKDDAERYRHTLEVQARLEITRIPAGSAWWSRNIGYTFGGLRQMTSLSESEFNQEREKFGLPNFPLGFNYGGSPYSNDRDADWWTNTWATLRPEQWEAFWSLFDRIAFYQVVEVNLER